MAVYTFILNMYTDVKRVEWEISPGLYCRTQNSVSSFVEG